MPLLTGVATMYVAACQGGGPTSAELAAGAQGVVAGATEECDGDGELDFVVRWAGLDDHEGRSAILFTTQRMGRAVTPVVAATAIKQGVATAMCRKAVNPDMQYPGFGVVIDLDADGLCDDDEPMGYVQWYGWPGGNGQVKADASGLTPPQRDEQRESMCALINRPRRR